MTEKDLLRDAIHRVRYWREKEVSLIAAEGFKDLSFRPKSGMAALGWVLAHQAAVYDFTLNYVIKGLGKGFPEFADLFANHLPGTAGEWDGTEAKRIQEYYDFSESAFLDWQETTKPDDFARTITNKNLPDFFVGKTVRQVIMDMICHLNYHSGHLTAIRRDCMAKQFPSSSECAETL